MGKRDFVLMWGGDLPPHSPGALRPRSLKKMASAACPQGMLAPVWFSTTGALDRGKYLRSFFANDSREAARRQAVLVLPAMMATRRAGGLWENPAADTRYRRRLPGRSKGVVRGERRFLLRSMLA